MSLVTVYPSRFTTRIEGDGVQNSKGDLNVASIFEIYRNRTAISRSWTFRKSVLETALFLFQDFDLWVKDQLANPEIQGLRRQFLDDTLGFIQGRPRASSISIWQDLIHDSTDFQRVLTLRELNLKPGLVGSQENTANVLARWCARRDGIEDLIWTLQILFGRNPNVSEH